jgi:SAM-dependent methyltransferase
MDISYKIFCRFDEYFRNMAKNSHNELLGDNSYQYCQTPLDFFCEALNIIEKKEGNLNNKKFLDIGCGLGTLCEIARMKGLIAEGIEINPILYNISKQLFPDIKIHEMNIMNFNNYNEFDIIYYWLPFRNPKLLMEFKEKVENNIRIGSYIVIYEEELQEIGKDSRFLNIGEDKFKNRIWLKIM